MSLRRRTLILRPKPWALNKFIRDFLQMTVYTQDVVYIHRVSVCIHKTCIYTHTHTHTSSHTHTHTHTHAHKHIYTHMHTQGLVTRKTVCEVISVPSAVRTPLQLTRGIYKYMYIYIHIRIFIFLNLLTFAIIYGFRYSAHTAPVDKGYINVYTYTCIHLHLHSYVYNI